MYANVNNNFEPLHHNGVQKQDDVKNDSEVFKKPEKPLGSRKLKDDEKRALINGSDEIEETSLS